MNPPPSHSFLEGPSVYTDQNEEYNWRTEQVTVTTTTHQPPSGALKQNTGVSIEGLFSTPEVKRSDIPLLRASPCPCKFISPFLSYGKGASIIPNVGLSVPGKKFCGKNFNLKETYQLNT